MKYNLFYHIIEHCVFEMIVVKYNYTKYEVKKHLDMSP